MPQNGIPQPWNFGNPGIPEGRLENLENVLPLENTIEIDSGGLG